MADTDKTTLNISGTSGTTYDLDEITAQSRTNSSEPLIVQVYTYSAGQSPNPSNLQIGQIWLSKKVSG